MGLFDDRDDKTEPATAKRLSEARGKGQVARSQELSMATLLLAAIAILQAFGPALSKFLEESLESGLSLEVPSDPDKDWALLLLGSTLAGIAKVLLPLMLGLVLTSILTGLAQVGFLITFEPLKPNLAKMNPVSGLGRLVSLKTFAKSIVSAGKLAVIGGVLWWNMRDEWPRILLLSEIPFSEAASIVAEIIIETLYWIAFPLLLIAIGDLFYQRWQFARDMRMSKQEIKDEQKSTEGDPEIKARIKRAQREIARRRMMEEVPKADVVITNPTHFAVALKYERTEMSAPTVVAKGSDRTALRIREIAAGAGVPIWEEPPLARALFRGVGLGEEIPPRFYKAVATVLAKVMELDKEAATR